MNRLFKLTHRLSNVLFVPTVMLILAGVVKCSQTSDRSAHDSLTVAIRNTSEPQSVQEDTNGNDALFENHPSEISAGNMNR